MATTVVKKTRATASKAVAPAAGAAATARTPRARPQAAEVTRRLAPEDREQLIVEKAIKYFATHGFTASTRDLAREMGVSQPLLYRYFPNKEALADRVFHEVYLSRWNPEWEELLADRSRSLDERLRLFYKQYGKVILKSDWIRIFIFAGLTREGINQRYLERLRERIFNLVLAEMRREFKIAAPTPQQYEDEIEFIWGLHAAIFYVGVRKWIYGLSVPKDLDRLIDQKVDAFLDSAPAVFKRIRKAQARA